LIDNGLINLADNFTTDKGHLLENIVAVHLLRHNKKFYYYKNSYECDFVVKEGLKIRYAIQVCYDIASEKTRKREINSLLRTMDNFNLKEGYILTYETDEVLTLAGKKIIVQPIWKYFLN